MESVLSQESEAWRNFEDTQEVLEWAEDEKSRRRALPEWIDFIASRRIER
jgi:hypothetical protein